MPTYTFSCYDCQYKEDIFHGIKEEHPEMKCPNCGKDMQQVITGGSGVIFTGAGWTRQNIATINNPGTFTDKTNQKILDEKGEKKIRKEASEGLKLKTGTPYKKMKINKWGDVKSIEQRHIGDDPKTRKK